jgi:hypothetical protein
MDWLRLLLLSLLAASCSAPRTEPGTQTPPPAPLARVDSTPPCRILGRHEIAGSPPIGPLVAGALVAVREHHDTVELVRFPPDGRGLDENMRWVHGPLTSIDATRRVIAARGSEVFIFSHDGTLLRKLRLSVPSLPPGTPGPLTARVHDLAADGDHAVLLWSVAPLDRPPAAVAISETVDDELVSPFVFGVRESAVRQHDSAEPIPTAFVAQLTAGLGGLGERRVLFGAPGGLTLLRTGCSGFQDEALGGDAANYTMLPGLEGALLRLDSDGAHIGAEKAPVLPGALFVSRPREAGPVLSVAYVTGELRSAIVWAARFHADGSLIGAPIQVAAGLTLDPRDLHGLASRTIGDRLWIYFREASHTSAVELACDPDPSPHPEPAARRTLRCECPKPPVWDEWIANASMCAPAPPSLVFDCRGAPFHHCARGFPEEVFRSAPRERVVAALEGGDEEHVLGAMAFLVGRGDPEAGPLLLKKLRPPGADLSMHVAGSAMMALARLHYRPAAAAIVQVIERYATREMGFADYGLPALAELGDASVAPVIVRLLKRSLSGTFGDATFFGDALRTLEKLAHPSTVAPLLDLARGRWPIVPTTIQVGNGKDAMRVPSGADVDGVQRAFAAAVGRYFAHTGEVAGTRTLLACARTGAARERAGCAAALTEMRRVLADAEEGRSVKRRQELDVLLGSDSR